MNTKTRTSNAERFGHWLGRSWRSYMRREQRVSGWLVAQGVPALGVAVLLWIVKLVIFGLLLYTAFWLTLLLVLAIAAAWVARNADWEEQEPEWKNGPAGHGLYTHDGHRIDPHVSDDD